MTPYLLNVTGLSVRVEGKRVVEDFSFQLGYGEIVTIMGANGSGKSSLANVLMGNPKYLLEKENARIELDGIDLLPLSADQRAKMGMFVAWQSPISIPGVTVFSMCKASYLAQGNSIEKLTEFKIKLEKLAIRVGLKPEHISRELNVGFSGGERKRMELLQLLLLKPKVAVLDEVDSGMDSDGVMILSAIVNEMKADGTSFVLITHNKKLLDSISVDRTLEMKNGRLSTGT